jgi:hypothetical protein
MLVPLAKHGTQGRHLHRFTVALDRAVPRKISLKRTGGARALRAYGVNAVARARRRFSVGKYISFERARVQSMLSLN